MSQAVAAPNTGESFVAPGKIVKNVGSPSRRALLTGLALAPAAMIIPALALVPKDAPFWTAVAQYRAIDVEWDAALRSARGDEDREEAVFEEYGPAQHKVLRAVVLATVSTPAALLAKLELLDANLDIDTGDDDFPDFWACLIRDVERLAA